MLLLLASPLFAPQLLAFPHKTETELGTVWSDEPLDPAMLERAVTDAQDLLHASPLANPNHKHPIFVTNGGWRWMYLANTVSDAFALKRPVSQAIVLNKTNPNTGEVTNGYPVGGKRTIAGLIAHEFTHGMIERKYGLIRSRMFETWKVEGYADHVAQESSLSLSEVKALERSGRDHPALLYFHARQRVEAELEANGGSVDALFLGN